MKKKNDLSSIFTYRLAGKSKIPGPNGRNFAHGSTHEPQPRRPADASGLYCKSQNAKKCLGGKRHNFYRSKSVINLVQEEEEEETEKSHSAEERVCVVEKIDQNNNDSNVIRIKNLSPQCNRDNSEITKQNKNLSLAYKFDCADQYYLPHQRQKPVQNVQPLQLASVGNSVTQASENPKPNMNQALPSSRPYDVEVRIAMRFI